MTQESAIYRSRALDWRDRNQFQWNRADENSLDLLLTVLVPSIDLI